MPLPKPEIGLVIRYRYLWHNEQAAEQAYGRKERPCAIVLTTVENETGDMQVQVVPITHTVPADETYAVALPAKTKKRLGLDDAPSWIICNEMNEFIWPGYDLAPIAVAEKDKFHYGVLPPALFEDVKRKIQLAARGKTLKIAARKD